MWFKAQCRLPYQGDPDYRLLLVAKIKAVLGSDVPVDVTLLQDYGSVEVDTSYEGAAVLQRLQCVGGEVLPSIDRAMLVSPRTIL
jgi:hypothetical protein